MHLCICLPFESAGNRDFFIRSSGKSDSQAGLALFADGKRPYLMFFRTFLIVKGFDQKLQDFDPVHDSRTTLWQFQQYWYWFHCKRLKLQDFDPVHDSHTTLWRFQRWSQSQMFFLIRSSTLAWTHRWWLFWWQCWWYWSILTCEYYLTLSNSFDLSCRNGLNAFLRYWLWYWYWYQYIAIYLLHWYIDIDIDMWILSNIILNINQFRLELQKWIGCLTLGKPEPKSQVNIFPTKVHIHIHIRLFRFFFYKNWESNSCLGFCNSLIF